MKKNATRNNYLAYTYLFLVQVVLTTAIQGQSFIKVIGSEQPRLIQKQAKKILHELDVNEDLHLTIEYAASLGEGYRGVTFSIQPPGQNNPGIYRILIDASMEEALRTEVLAHEIVHVKQYVKGQLAILSSTLVSWNGYALEYYREDNREMPWEMEAHRIDQDLVSLLTGKRGSEACDWGKFQACRIVQSNYSEFEYLLPDGVSTNDLP